MPAARQRSRSPVIACAVIATIGMRVPDARSCWRIVTVAASPSMLGHLDVHQNEVERAGRVRRAGRCASRPLAARLRRVPALLEVRDARACGSPGCPRRRRMRSGARRLGPPASDSSAPDARSRGAESETIASSRSDCLIGFVTCIGDPEPAAARDIVRPRRRREHDDRRSSAKRRSAFSRLASMKPSIRGIWPSMIASANGLVPRCGVFERCQRVGAARDDASASSSS